MGTILVGSLACVVAVAWMRIGRALRQEQPDIGVYYYSYELGDDLYSGAIVKPFMPEGGLPFTYTPFAALLFRALTALPFPTLTVVWAALNMLAAVAVAMIVTRRWGRRWQVLAAVATMLSTIMAAHMMMGQLNALLLLLIVLDVARGRTGGSLAALPRGLGVGIAASVKLTPAIVIVYFVVTRQFRAAVTAAATVVVCFVLGWLALPDSTAAFFTQLPQLAARVDVLGYARTFHNTGLNGLLTQAGVTLPAIAVGIAVCAVGLIVAARIRPLGDDVAVLWLALVTCVATPVTWIHHWVALPIALVVALRFVREPAMRRMVVVLLLMQIGGSVYVAALDPEGGAALVTMLFRISPVASAVVVGVALVRATSTRSSPQSPAAHFPPSRMNTHPKESEQNP